MVAGTLEPSPPPGPVFRLIKRYAGDEFKNDPRNPQAKNKH